MANADPSPSLAASKSKTSLTWKIKSNMYKWMSHVFRRNKPSHTSSGSLGVAVYEFSSESGDSQRSGPLPLSSSQVSTYALFSASSTRSLASEGLSASSIDIEDEGIVHPSVEYSGSWYSLVTDLNESVEETSQEARADNISIISKSTMVSTNSAEVGSTDNHLPRWKRWLHVFHIRGNDSYDRNQPNRVPCVNQAPEGTRLSLD